MTEPAPDTRDAPLNPTWWRRNRWALLVLPVVVALVAVAGAGRVLVFWLPNQLSDPVAGRVGVSTAFTDDYRDVLGEHERALDITVVGVQPDPRPLTSRGEPVAGADPVPAGTRLWQIDLAIEADPETVLSGCRVALVDAEGRMTERDSSLLRWDAALDACQPVDTVNPTSVLYEGMPTEVSTRPPAYVQPAQLVTAEDFEPIEVRVWWEPPTFLAVPLPDVGR